MRLVANRSKKRNGGASKPATASAFPIVGVGASAGGLEAFSQLLGPIPPDLGMAFVLIQHLDPTHPSRLVEALARKTEMPVHEIQDRMVIAPGHVYVMAPNVEVFLKDGAFVVHPRPHRPGKLSLPIDAFFCALAAERHSQAIGVVLSGTASDGTEGLRAIKAEGGVTIVQDPLTAKFSGMPESALASGAVDLSLPIPKLAKELIRLARHPYMTPSGPWSKSRAQSTNEEDLQAIVGELREAVGVDFSEYKQTTLERRIARRMAVRKADSLHDYALLIHEKPDEAQALFDDLLIHVTSFFRDPEVFDALKKLVFPEIVKHKSPEDPIRAWVAGCSTGEEVYSLAIALREFLDDTHLKRPIQIFGTDLSEMAVQKVRTGVYPESAVTNISPERLQRFFTKVEGGYRVGKAIRDICVFVRHDLGRDPPFAKLDLISCRNVLIYFNPALQQRSLEMFHYCLNTPGFLVLGQAEGIPGRQELFSAIDETNKVFARTAVPRRLRPVGTKQTKSGVAAWIAGRSGESAPSTADLSRQVDTLLLGLYAPAGVIVNERMEVLEFRGRTAPYLEAPPGQPQINLLKMVRGGLLSELRVAFGRAKEERVPVRRERVRLEVNGVTTRCNIVVLPIAGSAEAKHGLFAVLFEPAMPDPLIAEPKGSARRDARRRTQGRGDALEQELTATKEYLQSLITEHQIANEALGATNAELVSSNEELLSMNEELETAKEELQSTNEELSTLNDEMQNRNHELSQLNDDIVNLLNGVEIAIVIVDAQLRVRRFTPQASAMLNLLPNDMGRPISDIRPNVRLPNLDQLINEVMQTVTPKELEVQDAAGRWYRMQIRPYRTVESKINGAFITLVDVDSLKRAQQDAEWGRAYSAGIVEAVQVPLIVLDDTLVVRSANEAFYETFRMAPAETEGSSLFDLGKGLWNAADLRSSLGTMPVGSTRFQNVKVEVDVPQLGKRTMSLSARPVRSGPGMGPLLVLAIEDITIRERAEREREHLLEQAQAARSEAEDATRAKDRFLAVLSHELRTPLSALLLQVELLRRRNADGGGGAAGIERSIDAIERSARIQARLTDDLLDVSRIVSGKLDLALERVEVAGVVREAIEMVRGMAEAKSVALATTIGDSVGAVLGDPMRIRQIVWNLLTNAIKATSAGGRISIVLDRAAGHARLEVSDTGVGISSSFLPRIFDVFSQAQPAQAGGLGLGLAIVRHVVEQHHGTVHAASPGEGKGATFVVKLPLFLGDAARGGVLGLERVRASMESRDAAEPLALNGLRILVVDDDRDTREPLVEMLSGTGADVGAATSAADAMRMFEEFRPQLVVSDIGMPDEDGLSLMRRIRALGPAGGGDVRALALTAMASVKDREDALAAGFNMHLAKPIGFDELTEALHALVQRRRVVERRAKRNA